ncbi:MAG: hypothetical protein KC897_02320 [Candidatus Omnitrophica bacterium]|nr:hypothetical protein [Candidatus Omnitrophota bacterium]MCB9721061.1 hypothetical protein [Candidatus Omnitrophota bacterium]
MRTCLIFISLFISLVCGGCDAETRTRMAARPDYRMTPNHVVETATATSTEFYLKMQKGDLKMGAEALPVMVSQHRYMSPVRAPVLEFYEVDQKAYVALTQESIPSIGVFGQGDAMNAWDVQLNPKLPLDLTVEYGKGRGQLDLNGMNLDRLRIYNREGRLEIDLSAKKLDRDIVIWMNNHHGDIQLKLPPDAGAQITTIRGAEIVAENFTRNNAVFTNVNYEGAAHRIFVDVLSLSGNVTIQ